MSAYLVSKETIDVIVCGLNRPGIFVLNCKAYTWPLSNSNKEQLGNMLWNVNREAIGNKSNDTYFHSIPTEDHRDFSTLYGCLKCYQYQIENASSFLASQVKELIDELEDRLIRDLLSERGEKEIPWGI